MAVVELDGVVEHLRRASFPGDVAGLGDGELLELYLDRRDEAAFTLLVRRHGPMVLGVCRRMLHNEADAADAFQATFLVLVRRARSIHPRGLVGHWLYGVAYNVARKARTLLARRRQKEQQAAMQRHSVTETKRDPAWSDDLDRALCGLPARYRAPLVLCDLQGKTRKEAAHELGCTEGAVASRQARAKALLARRLSRQGCVVSAAALADVLSQSASAAVPPALVLSSSKAALQFAAGATTTGGISAHVVALSKGVLQAMALKKLQFAVTAALAVILFATAAVIFSRSTSADEPGQTAPGPAQADALQPAPELSHSRKPGDKVKHCIILWMSGGPSQIDTFDPKPGQPTGGPFKAIDTAAKGIQFSEHLPKLAKLAKDMVIIRTVNHADADHAGGTHQMQTGYGDNVVKNYPRLGCMLGKELGDNTPDLPHYFSLAPFNIGVPNLGPGFLGPQYGPLVVGDRNVGLLPKVDDALKLPPVAAFEALAKGKGEKHRKAVEKAFDLASEKAAVRDAYGRTLFGQSCLLARRLVEAGVPVIEVTLPGWDTHQDNFDMVKQLCGELDPAWATLMADLKASKLLDKTLIVWMGEFGRTPTINGKQGRDHWTQGYSVVLAGGGVKGGQAVGAMSADGTTIDQRPVSVPELFATIYLTMGIDPQKQNLASDGQKVRLVPFGTKALKEVLP